MGAEQSEPFLGRYDSDEEDPKTDDSYEADLKPRVWNWKRNACIHATLILLYTFSSFIIIKRQTSVSCTPEANLRENFIPVATTSKPTTFHNLSMTPYAGDKPKQDLDTAWEALLKPMNMRFSENELRSTNQASVSLPEEGGYLGWFGVFHSLHCVKMLRHSFDRARECNSTEEESKKDKGHVDHCIELLRQASICQPDTSLTTFVWHPTTHLPMFNVSESVHTCVDWDAFLETTKERVVSDEEMERLKNPLLESV